MSGGIDFLSPRAGASEVRSSIVSLPSHLSPARGPRLAPQSAPLAAPLGPGRVFVLDPPSIPDLRSSIGPGCSVFDRPWIVDLGSVDPRSSIDSGSSIFDSSWAFDLRRVPDPGSQIFDRPRIVTLGFITCLRSSMHPVSRVFHRGGGGNSVQRRTFVRNFPRVFPPPRGKPRN